MRLKNARNPLGMVPTGRTRVRDIFLNVALDAAGPFSATALVKRDPAGSKEGKVKNERQVVKLYAYVFTCLGTGITHIQSAQDLSCSSLILALSSITCRYGKPEAIYCDGQSSFSAVARRFESANDLKGYLFEPQDETEREILITMQLEAAQTWGEENRIKFHFGIPSYPQSCPS